MMKIALFKKTTGEMFFKINETKTEYSFDEKGMFAYIDAIIASDYSKPEIVYDKELKDLVPYESLFNEIYEEINKQENKFRETYEQFVLAKEEEESSSKTINDIFKK